MKKIIKSKIFLCVIVGISCIGIGVYGANNYNASEVIYNPINGDSMTVNDALNYLYNNFSESEITGDWNMKIHIDINPYNSGALASSYIQVYLQKGIFETIMYNHNFTNTFDQTTTVAFSDFSSAFTNLKFKIVEHIPSHNSSTFLLEGDAYINVYLIYNEEEILVFETTTSTTSYEKNEIISITEYIS